MRDMLIGDLEQELRLLNEAWQLELKQTNELLQNYTGRQVSSHLGHNLGNRAAELSELAGKIEQTQRILAYVRSSN